jgi:putative transposase
MRLVYRFDIQHNDKLQELCTVSKNLYNQALYIVKQNLKENGKWLGYSQLNTILQTTTNLEGQINYRLLKAQVAQQCLKTLDKNIKSYIKSIKDYSKNKSKYHGCPRLPGYKKQTNQLIYPNQSSIIRDGYVILAKDLKIRIPQYNKYSERLKQFQQVRILPKLDDTFTVEIVYICDDVPNTDLDYDRYSSIDLGLDNLVTMVMDDEQPLLFNGRQVKAKNQYFNKEISRLKSELGDKQRTSKQIRRLYVRRDNQMKDIFHKTSRKIVNLLAENKVGNLVVGYNKGWKDSINIGRRNNQAFVAVPYERLIDYIKYKCEMCGIKVIVNEESYTSKCDALALECIGKHEEYMGKRVKRGLYQSSTGKLINADVNGAINIMRKVVGDSEYVTRIIDSGRLFRPIRVDIL